MPEANTLTIGMMAVLAQYEREMISERTKLGLKAAKARGQVLCNPHLEECRNTDTTNAIKKRQALALKHNQAIAQVTSESNTAAGRNMSANELAAALNDAAYKSRRNCSITRTQVYRALASTGQQTIYDRQAQPDHDSIQLVWRDWRYSIAI